MAEGNILFQEGQFSCPMCRDLLKDPVTTPCGHSYCGVCINRCWDQEETAVYSCPQCRETFRPRPVLRRNIMLAEVVETLRKTELQAASPAHAGSGDVECDLCTERKHNAVKSCLVCLVSYCEDHLRPHYRSPAFKKHILVKVCTELHEKICSEHDKLMEFYCRTDQSFICYLCMMNKHQDHIIVTAKAERTEQQKRIEERQEMMQEQEQTVDIINRRTQTAVEDSERIFTEMTSFMEKTRSDVTELIRVQQKMDLSRAERLLNQLKQEIADSQRKVTELEQLSHTHDHFHFLQSFPSLCVTPGYDDSPSFTVQQHLSFDGVNKSLSDLKTQVEEICEEKLNQIRPQAAAVQIILLSEPKNREDFLLYFCSMTLDPNTAYYTFILSEMNKAVKCSNTDQSYSDHPERFNSCTQVLCKESVCGRCYWEVERSSIVSISVSYKEIIRKGEVYERKFGYNSQSWSLYCSSSHVSFRHNNIKTDLRVPGPSRIGVYVDHSAGTLSFYNVSDTMTLLHSVHTTFTQPLYAGVYLWNYGSSVRIL